MSTLAIRQKLHQYIETAHDKKIKAIFAIVEDEIEDANIIWTDEFVSELQKRADDFENGRVTGRTWQQVRRGVKKQKRG